jgi:hypothetical protein
VVTICTTRLNTQNSAFCPHSVFVCVETSRFREVGTDLLYIMYMDFTLKHIFPYKRADCLCQNAKPRDYISDTTNCHWTLLGSTCVHRTCFRCIPQYIINIHLCICPQCCYLNHCVGSVLVQGDGAPGERALRNLIVTQLVTFPAFYGTRKFITVFARAAAGSCPEPEDSSLHFPALL